MEPLDIDHELSAKDLANRITGPESAKIFDLMGIGPQVVADIIELNDAKQLYFELHRLVRQKDELQEKLNIGTALAEIQSELQDHEAAFYNEVKCIRELNKLLSKARKWQMKANVAKFPYLKQRELLDVIEDKEFWLDMGKTVEHHPKFIFYNDDFIRLAEEINKKAFASEDDLIKVSNTRLRHWYHQYIKYKWQLELPRKLFETFIGLVVFTLILGYLTNLISNKWLSLLVIPAVLWWLQKRWVSSWLEGKLRVWQYNNLAKSIEMLFRARAFAKCHTQGVKTIGRRLTQPLSDELSNESIDKESKHSLTSHPVGVRHSD